MDCPFNIGNLMLSKQNDFFYDLSSNFVSNFGPQIDKKTLSQKKSESPHKNPPCHDWGLTLFTHTVTCSEIRPLLLHLLKP